MPSLRKVLGKKTNKLIFEQEDYDSEYPTYLVVAADDAARDAKIEEASKVLLLKEAIEKGTVRVSSINELQTTSCELLSDNSWRSGAMYRRHEDPSKPTYFPIEKWETAMKRLCLRAVVTFHFSRQLRSAQSHCQSIQ